MDELLDFLLDLAGALEDDLGNILSQFGSNRHEFLDVLLVLVEDLEDGLDVSGGELGGAVEDGYANLEDLVEGFLQLRVGSLDGFLQFTADAVELLLQFMQVLGELFHAFGNGGDESTESLVTGILGTKKL